MTAKTRVTDMKATTNARIAKYEEVINGLQAEIALVRVDLKAAKMELRYFDKLLSEWAAFPDDTTP